LPAGKGDGNLGPLQRLTGPRLVRRKPAGPEGRGKPRRGAKLTSGTRTSFRSGHGAIVFPHAAGMIVA
jgi:hypothetical protein